MIFKVYEEKEQTWQRELKKFRSLYDSKLQIAQDKLAQIQQTMQMQNQQVINYLIVMQIYNLNFLFSYLI